MDATSTMDALIKAVFEFRTYFIYLSVPVVMLGLILRIAVAHDGADYAKQIMIIGFTVLIIGCYPGIFRLLIDVCLSGKEAADAATADELWSRMKNPKIIGADSSWNFGAQMSAIFFQIAWVIGYATKSVMQFFQAILVSLMMAVSPLVIAWMAIPATASNAYKFFTTTFAVAVWSLALSLADKFLLAMFDYIFSCLNKVDMSTSLAGAVDRFAVGLSANLAVILGVILVLCSVVVYVGIPLIVYNFIHGDSIMGGMHHAMQAGMMVAGGAMGALGGAVKAGVPLGELANAMVKGAKAGMADAAGTSRPSDGITSQPGGPKQSAADAAIKGAAQGAADYGKKMFDALRSKHGFDK